MKRKTPAKTILVVAFLGLALSALAQTTESSTSSPTPGYGLLGEEYSGLRFGYTDVDDGPPTAIHRYGFVANRPVATDIDAGFKYDYTHSSAFGVRAWQHAVSVGATGYIPLAHVKPFLEGNVGWVFQKVSGGPRRNSFMFLVAAGAEFQVIPRLVLTPYVSYLEVPDLSNRVWNYGLKGTFRIGREWSATAGVQLDEHGNIEHMAGLNRHF